MFSTITRRFAIAVALLSAFALAGCGDKEPEQRKAFIEFLQTRVINNRTVVNPALSEKERDAVGPYAAHYQIILDFHSGMNDVVNPLKDASLNQKVGSMPGLQANWKSIGETRAIVAKLPEALETQIKKAETARAALKQPEDLKAIYDQAFNKKIVVTSERIKESLKIQDSALQTAEELGRFLDENRSKVTLSGATIQIQDPSVQKQLQGLMEKYNTGVKAMMETRRAIMSSR